MTESSAKYMCTSYCPCPLETDFNQWNEAHLNMFGRTNGPSVAPFFFKGMVRATNYNMASFETFHQCYDMLQRRIDFTNYNKIHDGVLSLIESLENEYDCNGVCRKGLFHFFKPV